jgi:hypothetical protein
MSKTATKFYKHIKLVTTKPVGHIITHNNSQTQQGHSRPEESSTALLDSRKMKKQQTADRSETSRSETETASSPASSTRKFLHTAAAKSAVLELGLVLANT